MPGNMGLFIQDHDQESVEAVWVTGCALGNDWNVSSMG